jgi:cytochrome c
MQHAKTHMILRGLCALAMLVASGQAASATNRAEDAGEVQRLLTEHKCYICHSDYRAKAGPAYVDVAAQFRGTRDAESRVAAEIRKGVRHGGPWHMPPHPEVSMKDARAMARYILSLDARTAPRSP